MPSEKEKPVLKSQDYEIGGNTLRAFYDARGKLVFVLDYYTSDIKPNVLLVMTSHGDRKWDDVLANEYGVDLETVRPKKDNKYQKLDVEYDGLVVYDNLIRAYTDDGDVDAALRDLNEFRTASCRRAAMERLDVARAVAENARETIDRAGDSIVELQAKIKTTRAKLQSLRRNIGREPTKQSAAKILKTEARLEMLNSKLNRAKRRLENATKRLDAANDVAIECFSLTQRASRLLMWKQLLHSLHAKLLKHSIELADASAFEFAFYASHISRRAVFHLDQNLSRHKVLPKALVHFVHFILVVVRNLRECRHRHCSQQQQKAQDREIVFHYYLCFFV